ncbi:MAG: class I fructose-bisphosphate aldolase [Alphaproteobacteria bacterium]|nr:class I fructose-bisphosphate aldolase [Rickettsiales bacterium]
MLHSRIINSLFSKICNERKIYICSCITNEKKHCSLQDENSIIEHISSSPLASYIHHNYGAEPTKCIENLYNILLGGPVNVKKPRIIILPVDQGFEHGPHRSFEKNKKGFDPLYLYKLASYNHLSAFAAPLGMLQLLRSNLLSHDNLNPNDAPLGFRVPLVLKINSNDYFTACDVDTDPSQAIIATVDDAVTLGCAGIGVTIYPGSKNFQHMLEKLTPIIKEAKEKGLVVIVWAYPRGSCLNRSNNEMQKSAAPNALDVVSYAAHIACLIGAHIVKVKIPSEKKTYWNDVMLSNELKELSHSERSDRNKFCIREIKKSCFDGRRIVIFSGGTYVKSNNEILDSVRDVNHEDGNGSIIGRNVFQREWKEACGLTREIIELYSK